MHKHDVSYPRNLPHFTPTLIHPEITIFSVISESTSHPFEIFYPSHLISHWSIRNQMVFYMLEQLDLDHLNQIKNSPHQIQDLDDSKNSKKLPDTT